LSISTTNNNLKCLICLEYKDDAEILCNFSHSYCLECINSYFEEKLINNKKISMECTICKQSMYENKLKFILNDTVLLLLFKNHVFDVLELPKDYEIMSCNFCPGDKKFQFLINKNDFYQFFYLFK